jgi:hypothetical protein
VLCVCVCVCVCVLLWFGGASVVLCCFVIVFVVVEP